MFGFSVEQVVKRLGRLGSILVKAPEMDSSPSANTVFRTIAENSGDVVILVGTKRRAEYVSPSSLRLFGWAPEEMVGRGPEGFFVADDLQRLSAYRSRLIAGEECAPEAFRIIKKDGAILWVETHARAVRDPQIGAVTAFVLTLRDIEERKQREDRLSLLARTDGLTGLANRRAFDEALPREWQCTLRERADMSLLLIDIDFFKGFNDLYGHQVGDDCIRAVAAALSRTVDNSGEMAARYGGEEMAVILPGTDGTEAVRRAEALRMAIEDLRISRSDKPAGRSRVTVSIGVATALSRHGGTISMPEGLLSAADAALYRAKNGGRNRVEATLLLATSSTSQAA